MASPGARGRQLGYFPRGAAMRAAPPIGWRHWHAAISDAVAPRAGRSAAGHGCGDLPPAAPSCPGTALVRMPPHNWVTPQADAMNTVAARDLQAAHCVCWAGNAVNSLHYLADIADTVARPTSRYRSGTDGRSPCSLTHAGRP